VSKPGYRNLLKRYERYAPSYDRRFARYSDGTLHKALDLVPDTDGQLLDVACGTGLFESLLRKHRPRMRITGIDLSPQMLERARERFVGDKQVQFMGGSAERIDAADASYDVLVCNNAFHLVQDAPAALREFHRVLRPGGRAIIVDWCMDYPQIVMMDLFLRMSDRQTRNIRTIEALAKLMHAAGFQVMHRERFRVPPLWGLMALAAERPRLG
jgi:ubiquinone/menaquinone biosynthesis C-methylase UbiE